MKSFTKEELQRMLWEDSDTLVPVTVVQWVDVE